MGVLVASVFFKGIWRMLVFCCQTGKFRCVVFADESLPDRFLRLQGSSMTVWFNILHMVLSLVIPAVEKINLPCCAREYLISALASY